MSKQARILTKTEFNTVLAVIDSKKHAQRNRTVMFLSFYAGLRAKEIASLQMFNVVDDNRKVKTQFVLQKHQTKGSQSQCVFISTKLQKHLQKYVDSVCATYSPTDAFIKSQNGSAFSPLAIVQLFARIYKNANIKDASSHSGRRQFISSLANKSVNVRVIQALARHSNLNTTMLYIDYDSVKLSNAVDLVDV